MTSVLVVEDDPNVRRDIVTALTEAGFATLSAADGVDAVDVLQRSAATPEAIVLDIRLPRMDGKQFLQWMAGTRRFSRIPVVLIASDDMGEFVCEQVKALLRKPFQADALIARIRGIARG